MTRAQSSLGVLLTHNLVRRAFSLEIGRGGKRSWHQLFLPRLSPFLYKEEKIETTETSQET